MTTKFTKEPLIAKAKENVEFFRERLELLSQSQLVALSLRLAEITLASLEAEPEIRPDNFMMPTRIENIELRSPLEVEDMYRARLRHICRAAGLRLHEDE